MQVSNRRGRKWYRRAALGLVALGVDELVGEPPSKIHPLVFYGNYLNLCEEIFWTDTTFGGLRYLLAALVPVVLGTTVVRMIGIDNIVDPLAISTAVARRSLVEHANAVVLELKSGDLDMAREKLSMLVGRDTKDLQESAICAATIESIAENFNDAVVATLVWGNFFGTLGALIHRVANTCDALVGRRSLAYFHFGKIPARFDDILGWLPARVASVIVCRFSGDPWRNFKRSLREAKAHPSPNAGLMEASFAWTLGIQLGGKLAYASDVSYRPLLGPDTQPSVQDIERAIELLNRATIATALALALVDLAIGRFVNHKRPTKRNRNLNKFESHT